MNQQNHPAIQQARESSIIDLFYSAGIPVQRGKCKCPFHDEKTQSCFVDYKKSNRFNCFGCNTGGDAITFVMKFYKLTFVEAVEKITGINIHATDQPAPPPPQLTLAQIEEKWKKRAPIIMHIILGQLPEPWHQHFVNLPGTDAHPYKQIKKDILNMK